MTLDDLKYVFRDQLIVEKKLYFMLVDGDHKVVERHDATKLEELLPMLSCFEYWGDAGNMPRFVK
jgi:hypothetical protein